MLKNYNQSNLLVLNNPELEEKTQSPLPRLKSIMVDTPVRQKPDTLFTRKPNKFKPSFELYYYRDFIWKVGFSNDFIVEPVEEYEYKLKYFVGQGNNSNLIKGIMKRRPWFQLTDKMQDAHFVWTQIKNASVFQGQRKAEETIISKASNCERGPASESNLFKKESSSKGFPLFNA